MQEKTKQSVLDAFLLMLRPVVRILLRYGIGYREFAEVTKTAFVDVASADFGIRGRPTNISRVAVMTGLSCVRPILITSENSTDFCFNS